MTFTIESILSVPPLHCATSTTNERSVSDLGAELKRRIEALEDCIMRQQFRFNTPPYVLRKSELYRLWKERLFRELTQMGLIDLVDDTAPKIQRDLRQLKVSRDMTMNIIISRLDQDHHRV